MRCRALWTVDAGLGVDRSVYAGAMVVWFGSDPLLLQRAWIACRCLKRLNPFGIHHEGQPLTPSRPRDTITVDDWMGVMK